MWDRCREEDESAMVFVSSELGEHSITTRDIDVNENTIVQFEVRILDALRSSQRPENWHPLLHCLALSTQVWTWGVRSPDPGV